jgi:enterochelin esterase-like enzyme
MFAPPPTYASTEQLPGGRVTFRVCAPDATTVRVTSSDADPAIPGGMGGPAGLALVRDSLGLWSATTAIPMLPGTYRYDFQVNGVRVPDIRATRFSEEYMGTNSVLEVTGPAADFQAWDPAVPHGVVSTIEYASSTLQAKRRAHVYTPPGYMKAGARFPVLYLVHGAGDSDDSWTSIGHAHYILDNLIASGKAKPMIVVMPFGHTPARPGADMLTNTDFGDDLHRDLIPFIDSTFRTQRTRTARAMAGLSMGGAHTLNFGLPRSDVFASVGVFSMGLIDSTQARLYEARHGEALRRGAAQFSLVYYAIGKDDFLFRTVAPTRAVFERAGIRYVYHESNGGHTWLNWRDYLAEFAPQLFR